LEFASSFTPNTVQKYAHITLKSSSMCKFETAKTVDRVVASYL